MNGLSVCLELVFRNDPFVRRIDRVANLGFEAVEFWTWSDKNLDAVAAQLENHDLKLVNIAGITEQSPPEELDRAMTNPDSRADAVADVEDSIEAAARLNCPFVTVHLGPSPNNHDGRAYESVVTGLRKAAAAAEATDVTLLIEPLNHAVDHDGYFLKRSERAYELVDDVNSPAVGVLFDIYHQQVTEGNITENLCRNLDYIEHVHVADVPGRHEPGTGELNYPNIIDALDSAGYQGYVGVEFIPETNPRTALERAAELTI